jgi:hypothetical protein
MLRSNSLGDDIVKAIETCKTDVLKSNKQLGEEPYELETLMYGAEDESAMAT